MYWKKVLLLCDSLQKEWKTFKREEKKKEKIFSKNILTKF